MSLSLDLAAALLPLTGQSFVPAKTVRVVDPGRLSLGVDVLSVESLGCSFEELRLSSPLLSGTGVDLLKKWANSLCQRITYLLESLAPLEFDTVGQQALIRSSKPDQSGATAQYYEVVLSSLGAGQFSLRRFKGTLGQAGRQPVPVKITHEQLAKLVNDLVDTLPGSPVGPP